MTRDKNRQKNYPAGKELPKYQPKIAKPTAPKPQIVTTGLDFTDEEWRNLVVAFWLYMIMLGIYFGVLAYLAATVR